MELEKIRNFLEFTNSFRKTERAILAVGEDRKENDVEHSYQLAVFALYLNDNLRLNLSNEKLMFYSLFHDMDETFDGDVNIFDIEGRLSKEEKAKAARKKIVGMFPDWISYKTYADLYQNLEDEESSFVNGLDKILPVLNIILDGGRTWHNEETTLKMLIDNKRKKVDIHPVIKSIWNDIEKYLSDHEQELFGKFS
jgi:putative hydrolase of HD superfamily